MFGHTNPKSDRQTDAFVHTNQQTDGQTDAFAHINQQTDRQTARQKELVNYNIDAIKIVYEGKFLVKCKNASTLAKAPSMFKRACNKISFECMEVPLSSRQRLNL